MALVAEANDLCLADLQRYFDICYLGGTKCGALFGEAVVIFNDRLKPDFRYSIKQRGALLAKGRLLGIQFRELFRDDLYLNLAKHAVAMAQKLHEGIGHLFLYGKHHQSDFSHCGSSIDGGFRWCGSISILGAARGTSSHFALCDFLGYSHTGSG